MRFNTKIFTLLITLAITGVNFAYAANPNELISIKTDPVLKDPRGMISVKTDPVLSDPKAKISIKTDPVLNPRNDLQQGYNINFQPILDLIAAFEKLGAKVSTNLVEANGVTLLEVSVNGTKTTPFVVKCLDCEVIVFEY